MRVATVLAFTALLLSGCRSSVWEKPGVTATQVAEDTRACQQTSTVGQARLQETLSGKSTVLLSSSKVDRGTFEACMSGIGYVHRIRE